MTDNEKSVIEWVEQRGKKPGRRDMDGGQCVMHEYMFGKTDSCLDLIKQSIKDEIQKRDHKFEVLEHKLENFISKWALGIIVGISLTLFGGMFGFATWQMKELKSDMTVLGDKMVNMNMASKDSLTGLSFGVAEISIKQQYVLKELEGFVPEHKLLMEHVRETERREKEGKK